MGIFWEDDAWDDYTEWIKQDKKTTSKINDLIKDIQREPFNGLGKPEPLKDNLAGYYSRRIDEYNRIVYRAEGDNVYIASCKGHYKNN